MKSVLLGNLTALKRELQSIPEKDVSKMATQAVAFFDLTGSTKLKLEKGHTRGTSAALQFCTLCARIIGLFKGQHIKNLGDGVLSCFADPLDACRAALNIKALSLQLGLLSSAGLTLGRIMQYRSGSVSDIIGAAVDRCARIQSSALPGQILIDRTLYDALAGFLVEYSDLICGSFFTVRPKGVGLIELCELSIRKFGLAQSIFTPFRIHERGRLPIEEKVEFVNRAQSEVIEIGTGLTSFAKYFTGQSPAEFRNHIRDLLTRKVNVRCFALDPSYKLGSDYLRERAEKEYSRDMRRSLEMIAEERKKFLSEGLPGKLELYLYRRTPLFHCICVDGSDAIRGRMLISHYLHAISRAASPVYELSRLSNPDLFETYWKSILYLQEQSTES